MNSQTSSAAWSNLLTNLREEFPNSPFMDFTKLRNIKKALKKVDEVDNLFGVVSSPSHAYDTLLHTYETESKFVIWRKQEDKFFSPFTDGTISVALRRFIEGSGDEDSAVCQMCTERPKRFGCNQCGEAYCPPCIKQYIDHKILDCHHAHPHIPPHKFLSFMLDQGTLPTCPHCRDSNWFLSVGTSVLGPVVFF